MSEYFQLFPTVSHSGYEVKDITRRVKFLERVKGTPYLFLPYTIEGDDRPEDIAYYYYGDVSYVWLVYLSNNIFDLYSQWPLSQDNFYKHIEKKYSSLSGTTGNPVIDWTMNETILDNIVYYENVNNSAVTISKDTYSLNQDLVQSEWRAIRYFEYETRINDDKRTIQLVNNTYAKQMLFELKGLLK